MVFLMQAAEIGAAAIEPILYYRKAKTFPTLTPRRPTRAGQLGASRFKTVWARGSDGRLALEGS